MPVDYGTDAGRVRLLIPDVDDTRLIFLDDQIDAFLAMEGTVKGAAALALETAASSEVMVSKVIKTQDLTTNGTAVSDALLKRAAELRRQADEDDEATAGGLDIIDFADPFTRSLAADELSEP